MNTLNLKTIASVATAAALLFAAGESFAVKRAESQTVSADKEDMQEATTQMSDEAKTEKTRGRSIANGAAGIAP